MFNINKEYELAENEGSSLQTGNKYIVLHETTNIGAEANASYFKHNWATTQTYVQYVIGDGGKIYQVGADGYEAWGAGSYANANSPVQIELARTTDKATFKKDYATFVNFARAKAQEFSIPTTLDAYGNGIKTHKWISDNIWGSHTDPVQSYLEPFWGITQAKLAHDIANGISEGVKPTKTFNDINNVVTTLNDNVKGYTTYDENGKANATTNIAPNTGWVSNGIVAFENEAYFTIGKNIYLPQSSTTLNGKLIINYVSGYGVLAYDEKGNSIKDSNLNFKAGTAWKVTDKLTDINKIGWCYEVAPNTYVPAKYQQGSGFKG